MWRAAGAAVAWDEAEAWGAAGPPGGPPARRFAVGRGRERGGVQPG